MSLGTTLFKAYANDGNPVSDRGSFTLMPTLYLLNKVNLIVSAEFTKGEPDIFVAVTSNHKKNAPIWEGFLNNYPIKNKQITIAKEVHIASINSFNVYYFVNGGSARLCCRIVEFP